MVEKNELLERLYRKMVLIRLVEEAIADRYPEQEMRCPVHLSIGQEGAAAGVCAPLQKTDVVISAHRSHAHYLAKGGDLRAMLAELYGKEAGCAKGVGGSMHLLDPDAGVLPCIPIIGSSLATGVGAGLAFKQREEKRVSVVFFGDGAMEEGIFHESANFAALKKLPVIFVCENNLYSVCTPIEMRQPQRPLTDLAKAHSMPTIHENGNDAKAVYDSVSSAVDAARQGEGPTFMLLDTYRIREHCGPLYDLELGFRDEAEFETWKERCPLKTHRTLLENEIGWTEADDETLLHDISAEIEAAFKFAIEAPFPDLAAADMHVYA